MVKRLLKALEAPRACLTVDALIEAMKVSRQAVCADLKRAAEAGLVSLATAGCYRLTGRGRITLTRGCSPIGRAPKPPRIPLAPDTDRARIWSAMRALVKFTRSDLVELVAREDQDFRAVNTAVQDYITHLHAAGYLLVLQGTVKVGAASRRGQWRWRLVRDTGELPPQLRRTGNKRRVFDPNLNREVTADDAPGA